MEKFLIAGPRSVRRSETIRAIVQALMVMCHAGEKDYEPKICVLQGKGDRGD